uniref:Death domain-containing protein n=1 Tax=Amphimedon queenslandica TaxID=400682 RepID=A0A1X7TTK6_AMPQE
PVEQKEETEILQETETVHTLKDSNDEFETQTETENKEIQTTQTTLNKEIQFNYLVPSQDNLEGLSESQIAGKKLFLVQGDKPQLMNWEEYGLRISVPEDSLSASETVSVLALGEREGQGAGGQEGEAGGVGRSDREEEGNGLKEPVDCTEDSELSTSQSKTIVSTHSTGIPEATVYAGQVFYQREERRDLMRFTAARDLNVLHQYINKRYSNPEIDEDFTFQFNPSLKYLQLIFDGPQLKPTTGWTVSPHKNPCLIRERDILGLGDNSTKTTIPPSCLVSIYAENSPHTVPNLSYSVPLKGVQEQMEIIIIRPLRTMSSSDSGYSQALNISNLDAILTYLKEGHFPSSSWLDLGLKLGLSYDTTLKNIESNYSKVEDCLRECNS